MPDNRVSGEIEHACSYCGETIRANWAQMFMPLHVHCGDKVGSLLAEIAQLKAQLEDSVYQVKTLQNTVRERDARIAYLKSL